MGYNFYIDGQNRYLRKECLSLYTLVEINI